MASAWSQHQSVEGSVKVLTTRKPQPAQRDCHRTCTVHEAERSQGQAAYEIQLAEGGLARRIGAMMHSSKSELTPGGGEVETSWGRVRGPGRRGRPGRVPLPGVPDARKDPGLHTASGCPRHEPPTSVACRRALTRTP